uniref:AlNc14C197G8589 protein n=1 Tax=Albugo laibachii Nc14 TaxID=890382 RepID=F0WQA8_9STRA|nr:AlNc14C197G8589 [Albugo laibachii Nc14]|eukprot:CCA23516.1 AlNc14C197G8589 [Albugo laibachii Nc14]
MLQSSVTVHLRERAESEDSYEQIPIEEMVSTYNIDDEWEGIQYLRPKSTSVSEKTTKEMTPDQKARKELIEFYRQRARQSASAGKQCGTPSLERT